MENNNTKSVNTENFTLLEPTEYEKDLDDLFDNVCQTIYSIVKIRMKTSECKHAPEEHLRTLSNGMYVAVNDLYRPLIGMIGKPITCALKFKLAFIRAGGPVVERVKDVSIPEILQEVDENILSIKNLIIKYEDSNYFNKEKFERIYGKHNAFVLNDFFVKLESLAVSIIQQDDPDIESSLLNKLSILELLLGRSRGIISENSSCDNIIHDNFTKRK